MDLPRSVFRGTDLRAYLTPGGAICLPTVSLPELGTTQNPEP